MKWYSIKKYKPPTSNQLLIRIEKKEPESFIYERYLTGSLEDYSEDMTDLSNYEDIIYDQSIIDLNTYKVTHFAIIEPVEIEE